jgi:hypothetical protein
MRGFISADLFEDETNGCRGLNKTSTRTRNLLYGAAQALLGFVIIVAALEEVLTAIVKAG